MKGQAEAATNNWILSRPQAVTDQRTLGHQSTQGCILELYQPKQVIQPREFTNMRLLHTERLEFHDFIDSETPGYAILSHRWTKDEVSFQDFDYCRKQQTTSFDKISSCCSFTKKEGHEWVWIDTCCIDKRSSAELTEAINSMYAWYKKSKVCYAYLADVLMVGGEYGDWEEFRVQFRGSAWFTRGWTLQELLAPSTVVFVDRHWQFIGSKCVPSVGGKSLHSDISIATGISEADLVEPTFQCVARKLSWVSRRQTTRVEDMTYCMLGLCGVNMPLLYGEGENAFLRLQRKIIKTTDDESIFAWFCDKEGRSVSFESGLIAPSPRSFAMSGQIEASSLLKGKGPYSRTNKGLAYSIPRPRHWTKEQPVYGDTYSIPLQCTIESSFEDLTGSPLCPLGYTALTIDLIFCNRGWRRAHSRSKPCQLSEPSPWNCAIAEEGCLFYTIYIQGPVTIGIDRTKEQRYGYFQFPRGNIWKDPTGKVYEVRKHIAEL